MQKKFISNLGFLLLLNLLVKPFWLFGIDRAVQNITGAEAYGHYYALFNFSLLLNILLDLGITNFNNRNISMNRQLLQKHISGIIILRIILALVYMTISGVIALLVGYSWHDMSILGVLLVNQFLISGILYLRSNLAGLHMFKYDSIISVLDRGLMIMICGWLLWGRAGGPPFQIEWFIYAQTGSYVITLIVTLLMLSGNVNFGAIKWNKAFSLMILRKSYPFAVLILLMTFYNRVDSVMLERLLLNGAEQAGIYAQAYRLMEAGNMVAYLFAGLLLPIFSHMLKSKANIEPLLKTSTSLMLVPAIGAAIVYLFNGVEIMDALYKFNARESAQVGTFLMVSFSGMCISYSFGALLTASGKLGALNKLAASAMILNVVLNLILIPKLKANGAAMASMVTQLLMALSQILIAIRFFKIATNWNYLLRLSLFTVLSLTVAAAIAGYLNLPDMLLGKTMVTAVVTAILAFLTKAINLKEIFAVYKDRE